VRPVQLHQAVGEGIPDSFPPVHAAMSRWGTLPAATTSFVGRERQLEELVELLAVRRLVTLTGVGLRAVIQRIARQPPGLGAHLAVRVRTGAFCTYTPDPERPIDWILNG
jgi:hypothetical protein